ncbi:ribosomal protein S18-alanine N-acetyltransferase [Lentibacillus saliphilus]|uniref:ribosomal protein S18-alanine N-acetyltransferase n=1 Tax=Lentibacillus saliphilus TaxID=2737028 RepID=UPI001C30F222|nr:ribosomal protein S18-alanine N-acetyltransferase [Lentibacillus saliphilus]
MVKAAYEIREMDANDLKRVMEIDAAVYQTPWSQKVYEQELGNNPHAYYAVIVVNGHVAGYAGAWIVMDDAQITNIVIAPEFRGQKLGSHLFEHMLQMAIYKGAQRLSLEVRVSNVIAQSMYRKFGLVPGGIRKNYYKDNQEDAVVMWVNLL